MGLAGIEDLEAPGGGGNLDQAFGISEHEPRPLVGSDTARETKGKNIGIEYEAGARSDFGQQLLFGASVGGADGIDGQVDGVAQVEIVATPGRNVGVEHLLHAFRYPGGRMDTV